MVELKNVSAKIVTRFDTDSIRELVKKTGAASVDDVKKLMDDYPEYDWFDVMRRLSVLEREMALANKRGHEPEMFYTSGYTDQNLLQQDTINYGNILLLDNPIENKTRYKYLKTKPISQIKMDLAHTSSDGTNYISASNFEYRHIGPNTIPRIVSLIEMYEAQIERQSRLTPERNINLFTLDKDEKLEIIEEMYNEIIMYLIYNTKEKLVWNKLSDAQKKLYLSSAINKKQEDIKTKQRIKEYVANYTTLPELERVADHDLKVLKRFIVK